MWNRNRKNRTFLLALSFLQYSKIRLFESLKKVNSDFFNLNEKGQVNTILYGSQKSDSKCANQEIRKFVTAYIKATSHFDRLLTSNQ